MFSLQAFFGKDTQLLSLLKASAEEGLHSAQALIRLLNESQEKKALDDFLLTRRKEKRITEQITEQLCKSMVTPLDSEDIEALATSLYKIPKTVEKFAEHLLITPRDWDAQHFHKQADLLIKAAETVVEMVGDLQGKPNLEKIKDQNDKLQYLEGEADKLILEILKNLYTGQHDALKVVVVKELSEMLEQAVDRCRDAGNVVFRIVLKNC